MSYYVLVGLGSNLNNPVRQLRTAIKTIANHSAISLKKISSFYQSLPQGPQDQDVFVNAVISFHTALEPEALLIELQKIEINQGKVKIRHWGERCIDLDILFIDQLSLDLTQPELTVPHPHALMRDFVLIPALEIEPDWQLPNNKLLKNHLDSCLQHALKILPDGAPCL